jgi:hypothetical protein
MSGAFGWVKQDKADPGGTRVAGSGGFADAKQAYGGGAKRVDVNYDPNVGKARKIGSFAAKVKKTIPEAKHTLASAAPNVVIVVMDVTGSMAQWPEEIFRRLPLMYAELCEHLGSDDLEILFIAHGDARTDSYPIQVARFGKGPELDAMLASFELESGGGGQGTESHELVAYYLVERVDTRSAQNVFTVFITDEAACDRVDPRHIEQHLGIPAPTEPVTAAATFATLERKSDVYAIVCDTHCYDGPEPMLRWWRKTINPERVLHLTDSRRVVDVILGLVADKVGRYDQFKTKLIGRQAGTKYGASNVAVVDGTLALVRQGGTTKLLAPPDNPDGKVGGTRSLL